MNLLLLRKKFFQLAFSGKIVTPNITQNIDELYSKIKNEKEELIKKYNARKDIEYLEPEESEYLFDIPNTWKWIRLGEVGIFKKGPFGSSLTKELFVPKNVDTIKVYEQQNAINKNVNLGSYYITKNYFEEKMKGFELFPGDIIVSCAGTIGECFIMPDNMEKGIINQALMKMSLVPSINKEYFLYYFDYILKDISNEKGKGTGMKNIPPFDVFKQLLFPLPPLEEQKRIVESIKNLEKIIDELQLKSDNIIFLKNKIREKILYQAVTGELSNQSSRENFDEEYEIIKEKKSRLTKKEILVNCKIADEIIDINIPDNWKIVRLGNISKIISKGTTPKGGKDAYISEGVNYLRAECVDFELKNKLFQHISEEVHNNELKRSKLEKDDILITIAGTLGKSGVVSENDLPLNTNQAVSFVRLVDTNYVNPKYLMYGIRSQYVQSQFDNSRKETSIPNLTLEIIANIQIPMPPKKEQDRIVETIDQILKLIDLM